MSFKDLAGRAGVRELSDYQTQTTRAVEGGVFKLAGSVAQLKKLVDALGTPKDTVEHRHRISETNQAIQQLAKSLKDQLKALHDSAAAAPSTSGAPEQQQQQQQQLKAKRLLQDFANILQDYKTTQKQASEREAATLPRLQGGKKAAGGLRAGAGKGDGETAPLLDLEEGGSASRGGGGGEQGMEAALTRQAQQQAEVSHLENAVLYHEALIEERDAGIVEIQRQIEEVNEMFQDLAVLINDQGEQVRNLDEHITMTAERVKEGSQELVKADRSSRAARNKCLWLWLMAAVIVSVLLIILLA